MEAIIAAESEPPAVTKVAEARLHIAEIRRSKGLDIGDGDELGANAADLTSALEVLSQQLYTQPTHFLLEFLQNADDNSFESDVLPSLSIFCEPGLCKIYCNETGFEKANVEAISRIQRSTKADRTLGFIGEKGIGFKSVFKVAKVVRISSNAYTFKFDRDAPLGMIAPIWVDLPVETGFSSGAVELGTQFLLDLDPNNQGRPEKDLHRQLRRLHLDSVLLLFLRRLRKIDISVDDLTRTANGTFLNTISRNDYEGHGGEMVRITNNWTTIRTRRAMESTEYFVVRHMASNMPKVKAREGISASEVVLAFPFQQGKPTFHRQKAYAFLPIRESGYRFLLQADFLLIANREDIEAPLIEHEIIDVTEAQPGDLASLHQSLGNEWNGRLLQALAECFVHAVDRFNRPEASALKYTWLGFLQDVPRENNGNPFTPLTTYICRCLRRHAVLESQSPERLLVKPTIAVFVPEVFRDCKGTFILACATDLVGQHYLSSSYDSHDPEQKVLTLLGVEVMDFEWFLSILKIFISVRRDTFERLPSEWHGVVAHVLYNHANEVDLKGLPIIPLQDGRWVRQVDGQCHFETADANILQKTPEGIDDLLIVDAATSQDPVRRKLLMKMGVKDLTQAEVCRLVIARHDLSTPPDVSVDGLIEHATYLFEVSRSGSYIKKPAQFWVRDIDGISRKANTMYLDAVDMPICGVLPRPMWNSKILHPGYALMYSFGKHKEKWVKWLESSLDIATVIRLSDSSQRFTAEFKWAINTMPSNKLLKLVISSRLQPSGTFTKTLQDMLGAIEVTCENNQKLRLSRTCLPVKQLRLPAAEGLPFLRVTDPDAQKWKHLKELGVVVTPDLELYLMCLGLMQGKPLDIATATTSIGILKRIGLRIPQELSHSGHFASNAAIFLPHLGKWVPKSACVWESAAGVTGVYQLCTVYPTLQSFFYHQLQIPSTSIDKVILELSLMPKSRGDPVKRKTLIFSLSNFLRETPSNYNKLHALEGNPVMPIAARFGMEETNNLRSLNKGTWYFADRYRHYNSFQGMLDFAAFPVEQYSRFAALNIAIVKAWPQVDHCLSSLVAEATNPGTPTVLSIDGTQFLRSKLTYIRRITRTANSRGGDTIRKLDLLHGLQVLSASQMVIRTSLLQGQLGKPIEGRAIPAKVSFRDTGKELHFYIRAVAQNKLPIPALSAQVCLFCGIHDEKLQMLVTNVLLQDDAQDIEDMLSRARIDGFDDHDYKPAPLQLTEVTRPLTQMMTTTETTVKGVKETAVNEKGDIKPLYIEDEVSVVAKEATGKAAILCENGNRTSSTSTRPISDPEPVSGGLLTSAPSYEPMKQVYFGFSTPSLAQEPSNNVRITRPIEAQKITTGSYTTRHRDKENARQRSNTSIHIRSESVTKIRRGQRTTASLAPISDVFLKENAAEEERTGIQGELKVFRTLLEIDETLSEDCWTSELREQAGLGFTRWTPDNSSATYGDFAVCDRSGHLTSWLLDEGFAVPASRLAQKPLTFHIEVKSTVGNFDEPFHMSASQMNKCIELSAGSEKLSNVFVIFRVYDLADAGRLMVYIDPWTEINAGRLRREPDGWLVREVV